jgi:hypothetical protein
MTDCAGAKLKQQPLSIGIFSLLDDAVATLIGIPINFGPALRLAEQLWPAT